MRKFKFLQRFSAYTAYTAATFVASQVATLFSQSGSTVATLYATLHSRLFPSKIPINGASSGSSGSTFKNSSQELEISVPSWMQGDEFDHEDYDEWWEEHGDDDEETIEEFWDGAVYNQRSSWNKRAVDEAIEEENNGTLRDIPL